jgi:hypothetical protein
MYKPSNMCVNGVILREVLFWESCFFGTVLLCNSLNPPFSDTLYLILI